MRGHRGCEAGRRWPREQHRGSGSQHQGGLGVIPPGMVAQVGKVGIWPGHLGEESGLGMEREVCFWWHGGVKGWLLWGWLGSEYTWWWARRALFSSCPVWGSEQRYPPFPAG